MSKFDRLCLLKSYCMSLQDISKKEIIEIVRDVLTTRSILDEILKHKDFDLLDANKDEIEYITSHTLGAKVYESVDALISQRSHYVFQILSVINDYNSIACFNYMINKDIIELESKISNAILLEDITTTKELIKTHFEMAYTLNQS